MQVTGSSNYSYLQQMQQMQQALFNKADGNGAGSLSTDEFEAAGQDKSTGSANDADNTKKAALFKTIDSNADGEISSDEMSAFSSKLSSGNQAQLLQFQQQLFTKADANGDGKVTQDELTTYMAAQKPGQASGGHGHHHMHGAGGGGSKSLSDLLSATADPANSTTDPVTESSDPLNATTSDSGTDAQGNGSGSNVDFGKQLSAYIQQMLSGYADQTQNSMSGISLVA